VKSGSRVAILVKVGELKGICVFRAGYLEHLFLGGEGLVEEFKRGKVVKEVNFSNFGTGNQYDGELVQECQRIVELIKEKLKKEERKE
jgi:hypothetical protein